MPSARTYAFFGLNGVRILSIVALLLVLSSSIFVMVTNVKAVNSFQALKASNNGTTPTQAEEFMLDCDYIQGSTVPNQAAGVFWAVVSGLLVIFQDIMLILSEIGWPSSFFDHFFPVLGPNFGLGALGIFQCLIGAQILSHHVDQFTLVSAFFLFSLGCLNMVLGLIFRESAKQRRSIRAWQDDKPVLPTVRPSKPIFINVTPNPNSDLTSSGSISSSNNSFLSEKAGYGFGRQGEKAAGLKGFVVKRPDETLPRYSSPSPPPSVKVPRPVTPVTRNFSQKTTSSSATSPAKEKIRRMKSTTSSFASPDAYRLGNERYSARTDEIYLDEDDLDFINDEDSVSNYGSSSGSRTESPVPTFMSSPTAL